MRRDKESAIALRKRGYSYNLICSRLKVPKSTLSDWFSNLRWSRVIKKDLTRRAFEKVYPQLRAMSEARSLMWEKWREQARKEAVEDFKKMLRDSLFISGVMIYWGEGDKNPVNPVRVSNADPRLLRVFVKFLKERCYLPETKIKAHLILYPDLLEDKCKKYWSAKIGIKSVFFNKTQFIKGRHKTRRLNYGICCVEVTSRQLKEKILVWIETFSKQL